MQNPSVTINSNPIRRMAVWAALGLIIALGGYLRLLKLGELGPFVDESGHVLIGASPEFRRGVASFEVARPLLSFLYMPAPILDRLLGLDDLMLAGRLMTVACGLITTLGIFYILRILVNARAALLGSLFWMLCPMTVLHERIALQDPFSAMFLSLAGALIVSRPASDRKVITAYFIAGSLLSLAILNKVSGLLTIPWIGGIFLLAEARHSLSHRSIAIAFIAGMIPAGLYVASDASNFGWRMMRMFSYHMPSQPNSFIELFESFRLGFNLYRLTFWEYYGYPGSLVLLFGFIFNLFLLPKWRSLRYGWIASALASCIAYSNMGYSRYLIIDAVPLFLIVASGWEAAFRKFKSRLTLAALVITLSATLLLWTDRILLVILEPLDKLSSANQLSSEYDYFDYVLRWSSGYKTNEITSYLDGLHEPFTVIVSSTWAPGAHAVKIACLKNSLCRVVTAGPWQQDLPFITSADLSLKSKREVFILDEPFCPQGLPDDTDKCSGVTFPVAKSISVQTAKLVHRTFEGSWFRLKKVTAVDIESVVPTDKQPQPMFQDQYLAPFSSVTFSTTSESTSLRISGSIAEPLLEVPLTIQIDGIISTTTTLRSGRNYILLPEKLPAGTHTATLKFGAWQAIYNPFDVRSGYWNASRAVSFKLDKIRERTDSLEDR